MGKQSGTRWWEFYFVRYAMGTVIGGVIIYLLLRANPSLNNALLFVDTGKVTPSSLALLEAYGLAFCYIASVPILSTYAGRFCDIPGMSKIGFTKLQTAISISVIGLFLIAMLILKCRVGYAGDATIYWISGLMLSIVTSFQLGRLIPLFLNKDKFYEFYRKLAAKRASASDVHAELVESYRHLREHGNSIVIVVLEIVLALILGGLGAGWGVSPPAGEPSLAIYGVLPYTLIILIWIGPGCAVWVAGLVLERKFWRDETL